MKPREDFLLDEPAPPPHSLDAVKPPKYWEAPPVAPSDPMAYVRSPVSSAHMIDDGKLSARDSVALSSSGAVVHGRYGELGVIQDVPLEYLALLRPAAEGAAALRSLPASDPGTLIVYGASQASGLAVVQLAAAAGHAVVAVVDGSHSGNEEIVDAVKGLAVEPGCAVAEEYALCKKNFEELVGATTSGEVILSADPGAYLVDFKANMMEYAKAYPESRPAAVSQSHLDFYGKDKDRENFQENMTAYLQQYPAGSPPIDPAGLEANFTQEKYSLFKSKFNDQTAAVITGDDVGEFNPAEVVSSMIHSKASGNQSDEDPIQYQFSLSKNDSETETIGGGPVIGAVIVFTPELERAAVAVAEAGPTKRAKAEALQCLSASERNAFSAATAVAGEAAKRGAAVRLIGGKKKKAEEVGLCWLSTHEY